ncbi:type II toxin-antitoxin system RelB family antitoxin [Corynebacterium sp. H130]|uniref:type II toxin-antitoxin system RelB family antitoxin n=1 Tax=Corynebacterium sp. H130 TaxID=3133444 RepID=UPI0030A389C4
MYSTFDNWEAEHMATMTVRMNEADAELVRKFAAFEGMTISDFARTAIMEKIEDVCDREELRTAVAADTGERFRIDQILDELS